MSPDEARQHLADLQTELTARKATWDRLVERQTAAHIETDGSQTPHLDREVEAASAAHQSQQTAVDEHRAWMAAEGIPEST